MPYLTVRHKGSHRFEVNVEGHLLVVDQEVASGGRDAGPSPTELLAASLATCAGAYAETYLVLHGYGTRGLSVACHYQVSADEPLRISRLDLTVNGPANLPEDRRLALLKAVEKCIVGNTLRMPPTINVLIAGLNGGHED